MCLETSTRRRDIEPEISKIRLICRVMYIWMAEAVASIYEDEME